MKNLVQIEQNGVRVLTTSQLAEVYGVDKQLIVNNFNRNRSRYVEGKHFIALYGAQKNNFFNQHQIDLGSKNAKSVYLWTEKGAWFHAKSLNTDQAWDAYEKLVDDYYVKQQQVKILSEREQLLATMKLSLEMAEEFTVVKKDVDELKDKIDKQMTLDYGQQLALSAAKNRRVEKLWDELPYNEFHDTKRKLHAQAWKDLKFAFGVASYRDIRQKDFQEAVNYVNAWRPRMILAQ